MQRTRYFIPLTRRAWIGLAASIVSAALVAVTASSTTIEHRGAGGYSTESLASALGADPAPLSPNFRIGSAAIQAPPTNQWYSTTIFHQWAYPLYAQPLSYRPTAAGFEVGLPHKTVVIENDGRRRFVRYPHAAALTVASTAYAPTHSALAAHDDWMVTVRLATDGGVGLDATVLHGSPYSYYTVPTGDIRIHFATAAELVTADHGHALTTTINGHTYGIYMPSSSRLERASPTDVIIHLTDNARFVVVAGLPDDQGKTHAWFEQHAYALPVETRVTWHYDEASATITSTFHVTTRALEGTETTTLMGLMPHQWSATVAAPPDSPTFDSVRGPIRVIAANEFTLTRKFNGLLPRWGDIRDEASRQAVATQLDHDIAASKRSFTTHGNGTYWVGKALGRTAQLAGIAEAQNHMAQRDDLVATLKHHLETWLDGRHPQHFLHDPAFGALFGFPQEFASVTQINDHHFHYGYWIQAAAAIGLRDPDWLNDARWGAMVRELVKDIATTERGRTDYPFLRNFDPYESHSWASGTQPFEFGNNQESSSEAVNAWAGLILLGEAMHDRVMRDLGIYLYTSEVAAVQQYWFDLPRNVLAPELASPFASIVFGGMYGYNTWWTDEPRQIMGINLLPLTPASTYLGQDPAAIERNLAALPNEMKAYQARGVSDGSAPEIWQDIFAEYQALSDPAAARKAWDRHSYVEVGNTRTHTMYWIESLAEMGRPDFTVTADTALYSVFSHDGRRTHLAYNASDAARDVHFSDGTTLTVAPHTLARDP